MLSSDDLDLFSGKQNCVVNDKLALYSRMSF